MSWKLQKLVEPGLNVQGVPMGLVNYMCLNRTKTLPRYRDSAELVSAPRACTPGQRRMREREPDWLTHSGFGSPILWADLALARPGVFEAARFLTINWFDWRRH